MKNVDKFAEELSNAYSTYRYKNGWGPCIKMLRKRGYDDKQIEAIIRSKWTRWAADASEKPSGRASGADLETFLYKMKKTEREQVEALTREHWGNNDEAARPERKPTYKLIYELRDLPYEIKVYKAKGLDVFKVKYGQEIHDGLAADKAAAHIGESILHALQCEGKLD